MTLWQGKTREEIITFTVGDDYKADNLLLPYDAKASRAHATMLHKMGVLNATEYQQISESLYEISKKHKQGTFTVRPEDEDSHSAIEQYLTAKLGDIGKKIHTARSRNDQSAAMIRLYILDSTDAISRAAEELVKALRQKGSHSVPIPGYTHMQKAMPSTSTMWLEAFSEALSDDLVLLATVRKILDQNPLGSGAGYGIPMKIDRGVTTKELGFTKEQSVTYVQHSRGKFELLVLQACQHIMLDINKLATDIMLFSTSEFGYVSLPEEFLTGSSMMPQKKNYDVMEIVQGSYGEVSGDVATISGIIGNLPSGYNRDLQLTKKALIRGVETTLSCLHIMTMAITHLHFNEARCRDAMSEELLATQKAYELVSRGIPFRDAYRQTKRNISDDKQP